MDTTQLTGPRKRFDTSLVGQLNMEWAQLCTSSVAAVKVSAWALEKPALAGCVTLADIETRTVTSDRRGADTVLIALLELAAGGEQLAGRTVLQLMLGKAVRIAASHAGRADRDLLEQLAVTALWDVIATYPITRRPEKVAANLSMDTLHQVVAELAHDRHESAIDADTIALMTADMGESAAAVVDLELFEVLAWGIDTGAISRDDAALLTRVYCAGPHDSGGASAAAEFGLSWPAARQRCSRAVRRLAAAVRADALEPAA